MINGTRLPVEAELAGQPFPTEQLQTMRLTLAGAEYTAKVGDMIDKGTLKLDPAAVPMAMEIIGVEGPNQGKTFLAIYEVVDDSLRICYDLAGEQQPTEFKTELNTQQFLVTYRREE
jgi:uncharacterized protein (TIGR03067 family)